MNQTGWSCFFMCNAQLERMENSPRPHYGFSCLAEVQFGQHPCTKYKYHSHSYCCCCFVLHYCGNVSNVILGLMAEYKINMIHTHNFHFLLTFSSLRKELFSRPIGFEIKNGKVAGLFCKNTR